MGEPTAARMPISTTTIITSMSVKPALPLRLVRIRFRIATGS
jgi:hypothetical protein